MSGILPIRRGASKGKWYADVKDRLRLPASLIKPREAWAFLSFGANSFSGETNMYVLEIFIPLTTNDGRAFPRQDFQAERTTLTDRFGGLTVYSRAPAAGFWEKGDTTVKDDIAVFEVMVETIDTEWWTAYRSHLEHAFQQDKILIRAFETRML
jgi:hypothetical protein